MSKCKLGVVRAGLTPSAVSGADSDIVVDGQAIKADELPLLQEHVVDMFPKSVMPTTHSGAQLRKGNPCSSLDACHLATVHTSAAVKTGCD